MQRGLWVNLKAATLIVSRWATSRGAWRDLYTVMSPSYCKCINHSNYALTYLLLSSLYIASLFNNSYDWRERNIPWTTYPLRKHTAWLCKRKRPVKNIAKVRTNLQMAPLRGKMVIKFIISHTIMRKKFSKRPMFCNGNCGKGTGCRISTEQIIRLGYKWRLDTCRG